MDIHSPFVYGIPAISVVGDGFCVPHPVDLTVKRTIFGLSVVHYDVLDLNGNQLLQVDGSLWQLQKKRVMRDPSGSPILTLREKVLTWRHRWTVHHRENKDASNVLFNVQLSHPLQIRTQLDVFLAANAHEAICNFHVIGSWSSLSFKVYRGDALIAEVKNRFKWGSFFKGQDNFEVRVYPGVDYAFIIALLVILCENYNSAFY